MYADKIIVLNEGCVTGVGTHDELLAKQGKYYELWNLQQGIFRRKKEAPAPAPAAVVEEDDDGEWYYVESGKARGFIKAKYVWADEKAERYVKHKKEKNIETAEVLKEAYENKAFLHTQTTAYKAVAKKKYALTKKRIKIYDSIPQEETKNNKKEETEKSHLNKPRPKLRLLGHDGNIFSIMSDASILLKNNDQTAEAKEMCKRVLESGDYYKALLIISEYVETELSPPPKENKKTKKKNQPER